MEPGPPGTYSSLLLPGLGAVVPLVLPGYGWVTAPGPVLLSPGDVGEPG